MEYKRIRTYNIELARFKQSNLLFYSLFMYDIIGVSSHNIFCVGCLNADIQSVSEALVLA